MFKKYPFFRQYDKFDCGPTCLLMVAKYYGATFFLDYLRDACYVTRQGVSLLGLSQAAEKIGLSTLMVKLNIEALKDECPLPAIIHWDQNHFVVLYNIEKRNGIRSPEVRYVIGDPAHGLVKLNEEAFLKYWQRNDLGQGVLLLLEPNADFFLGPNQERSTAGFSLLFRYLRPFRKQLILLTLTMMVSLGLVILLPYITKGMVDKGVLVKQYSIVGLFAVSQLLLHFTGTFFDTIRGRIFLNINAKISLNIVSEFLEKLLRLPMHFFETKSIGDITQRINDHHKIEVFLTGDLVNTLFSLVQAVVFSFILLSYQLSIWAVFVLFSVASVCWIFFYQKKRKQIDYLRFAQNKTSQEKIHEMVAGMQEIKLYNAQDTKRWEWSFHQRRQHKLNITSLRLEQYQLSGFYLISHIKNVLISFLSAVEVIEGKFSLGVMLSISFIIGQTNGPLQQLVQFFKSAQDAKLSFDRLQEIHSRTDNEDEGTERKQMDPPTHQTIKISELSFQYQGPRSPEVLRNISLKITKGKITAVVGASGSGKSTLLKLLLAVYQPTSGKITVDGKDIHSGYSNLWRSQIGTVMQDGYIFNDSIKKNITMNELEFDQNLFSQAVRISNLDEFVQALPLQYNTRIGNGGIGLSGGQKQRILLARAIYKNPDYLFFDEATSSLDANNEVTIMSQLENFFIGKTVVIVAHRLSTVCNADHIIVLEAGKIVEEGDHLSLTLAKGKYYQLVKNQLEFGIEAK